MRPVRECPGKMHAGSGGVGDKWKQEAPHKRAHLAALGVEVEGRAADEHLRFRDPFEDRREIVFDRTPAVASPADLLSGKTTDTALAGQIVEMHEFGLGAFSSRPS
jgi:hypothetical protein